MFETDPSNFMNATSTPSKFKIYVVGFGGGNPEHLTLEAKKYLQSANLIFYDSKIHPNLFFLSSKEAKWVSISSLSKRQLHSKLEKQLDINQNVVFLIPGAPEPKVINALLDNRQFPYTLIPGISSDNSQDFPLPKNRAIVLRGIDQSQSFLNDLVELGLDVIQCPMIEIIPNKQALKRLTSSFISGFTSLIFTSSNGVTIFFHHLIENEIDIRILANKKIFAVGPKTAESLKLFGLIPDAIPEKFAGDTILKLYSENLQEEKILIPRAKIARQTLPEELKARGAKVCDLSVYRTVSPKLKPIAIQDNDLVIFTSSSTADHFFQSKLYKNQRIVPFCIGDYTRLTVAGYFSGTIYTSDQATAESLTKCIEDYLKNE
ncbi:MAG: uroporphyrinogen-III synthase [Parachlamydiales bacterium]|jgi:uroporphyrinogen-III synthase